MALPAEDVVLYSIIAFIVIENVIEIYLSLRQVSESTNKQFANKPIATEAGAYQMINRWNSSCHMSHRIALY